MEGVVDDLGGRIVRPRHGGQGSEIWAQEDVRVGLDGANDAFEVRIVAGNGLIEHRQRQVHIRRVKELLRRHDLAARHAGEIGDQAFDFLDALFEDMYEYSESQGLEIDTLIHESGVAQMEINLRHGDPLELADQVLMFKRTIKETALEHDIYATFMAKPMANEPGSAMHIHQSIIDAKTGHNLFSDQQTGGPTDLFFAFIAGQQKYMPAITSLLAPYVNSYRRLAKGSGAPVNTQWGYDNRTAGLRVPPSDAANRRLENRIPSSDANPYLAIAAVLASGYLGMIDKLKPSDPVEKDASTLPQGDLPYSLVQAIIKLERAQPIIDILGPQFVTAYSRVKLYEYETFMQTISPWEREFLLLNV